MSDPVIACYVAQRRDSYELFAPETLDARKCKPIKEDEFLGEVVGIRSSGNFRDYPYFPVYATAHSIRETAEMARDRLGALKAPLDVFQANKLLFETLAKNGDCLVGKIISPEE